MRRSKKVVVTTDRLPSTFFKRSHQQCQDSYSNRRDLEELSPTADDHGSYTYGNEFWAVTAVDGVWRFTARYGNHMPHSTSVPVFYQLDGDVYRRIES